MEGRMFGIGYHGWVGVDCQLLSILSVQTRTQASKGGRLFTSSHLELMASVLSEKHSSLESERKRYSVSEVQSRSSLPRLTCLLSSLFPFLSISHLPSEPYSIRCGSFLARSREFASFQCPPRKMLFEICWQDFQSIISFSSEHFQF